MSLNLEAGRTYSLVGKSGSGKTSLASIIGLLNSSYTGQFTYQGLEVASLRDSRKSALRAESIGFVFQNYSLIKHLNVFENVELALMYMSSRPSSKARKRQVQYALSQVGLEDRMNESPGRLSGGEQQRVAIARALVTRPQLIICDEPTGALDTVTSEQIVAILQQLVNEYGSTLLLVTHDPDLADTCDEKFVMSRGRIVNATNVT
ncbi:ABC transporter ATP-binding protein [Boudabousia marimammalium]|uniref:ABC transporter ATP-binding protein n=1 Tax=Boudabousia marimammalium TaxID=156892 RepID=UPI001FEAFFB9|nr:ABC transporter ATP-binding protein [Boudabousia marimammalium]